MSELGNNLTPSITKSARTFNSLDNKNIAQGIRSATNLDAQITEAIKQKEVEAQNPIVEETYVPTGDEIRHDREEGEYSR